MLRRPCTENLRATCETSDCRSGHGHAARPRVLGVDDQRRLKAPRACAMARLLCAMRRRQLITRRSGMDLHRLDRLVRAAGPGGAPSGRACLARHIPTQCRISRQPITSTGRQDAAPERGHPCVIRRTVAPPVSRDRRSHSASGVNPTMCRRFEPCSPRDRLHQRHADAPSSGDCRGDRGTDTRPGWNRRSGALRYGIDHRPWPDRQRDFPPVVGCRLDRSACEPLVASVFPPGRPRSCGHGSDRPRVRRPGER